MHSNVHFYAEKPKWLFDRAPKVEMYFYLG